MSQRRQITKYCWWYARLQNKKDKKIKKNQTENISFRNISQTNNSECSYILLEALKATLWFFHKCFFASIGMHRIMLLGLVQDIQCVEASDQEQSTGTRCDFICAVCHQKAQSPGIFTNAPNVP